MKEFTKEESEDKMELVYFETELGFHFAVDFTYIDQMGDFEMILPTGEVFNSKKHCKK